MIYLILKYIVYLYWFNKYAWVDKVWKTDWDFKSGDLLQISDEFYLSLWKDTSFFEQYVYGLKSDISKTEIAEKKLLNKQTLELMHRMVYQRYSTYKNVVKLFLPQEMQQLIDRKTKKKSKKTNNIQIKKINILDQEPLLAEEWQTLIIFPDLRTLINFTQQSFRETLWVDTLISTNTQNQKDKSRRNIKVWNTHTILATHSEVFQNYKKLKKVIIIQPHKRYYSNQQDPRYKTSEVIQKMTEIWKCELEIFE